MAVKPEGQKFLIAEQIIEDPMTGLTLWVQDAGKGFTIIILGNFENGNREFAFNEKGENIGAGSAVCCVPSPNWLTLVNP